VFGDSPTRCAVTGPLDVFLPAEIAERLRRRAAETGRPAPALVAEAVEQWLGSAADRLS
jgi:predicted DNA-binding protein